jgi:NhaP-type Na+/H+ or K+/H+ antiporter
MFYCYVETNAYIPLISTAILKEQVSMFVELQELGTDTNLYALVFGESVLNDAVCRIFFLIPYPLFIFFLLMLIKFSDPSLVCH